MTTDVHAMQGASPMVPTDAGSSSSPAMPRDDSATAMHVDVDVEDDTSSCDGQPHRKYERKSKRFAWPNELHRLFVAAIFDLGLKNASPKALLPFMMPAAADAGLTSEHLKSHLQKYRLNYEKSRAEFLAFFDESARRNGKRRRRTAKSMVSHTRFIFPINPRSLQDEMAAAAAAHQQQQQEDYSVKTNDADPAQQQPVYSNQTYAPLTPRTSRRLERAQLLRLAQHNAALALAAAASQPGVNGAPQSGGYGTGLSPRPLPVDGSGETGVTDAQWGILAALLSPQLPANSATAPQGFSLNDSEASPDLQLQMHLAMQAQMNLHRQMLTRKVAVSQHYYNQAAAVKRAAASAMVERALQNAAAHQHERPAYPDQVMPQRPSLPDTAMLQAPTSQPMMVNASYQQPPQRFTTQPTSVASDALLQSTWDPMEIDMADDQHDLFSFLKATE